jgi:hypothetical protein
MGGDGVIRTIIIIIIIIIIICMARCFLLEIFTW